jgi:hypothetical protein
MGLLWMWWPLVGCERGFEARSTIVDYAPDDVSGVALTFDGVRFDDAAAMHVSHRTPRVVGACADSSSYYLGFSLPAGGVVEFEVFAPGWDPLPRSDVALAVVGTDRGGVQVPRLSPPDLVDVDSWLSGGMVQILGGEDVPGGLVIDGSEVCDAAACRPTDGPILVELDRPWIEPTVVETTNANGPSGVTDEEGLELCN